MNNSNITTTQFLAYLESLNLFRWRIFENANGMEAILSADSKPNLKNFTRVNKQGDGTYKVRLSNNDYFNNAITNGFFNQK